MGRRKAQPAVLSDEQYRLAMAAFDRASYRVIYGDLSEVAMCKGASDDPRATARAELEHIFQSLRAADVLLHRCIDRHPRILKDCRGRAEEFSYHMSYCIEICEEMGDNLLEGKNQTAR